jgi:adenine-specific DNA-methyltransferase
MMYPRLKLAQNLLRRDGLILISLDEAEISNLRQLCNEIFGEENLVANLVWEKGRKNDAKLFSLGHEYVMIYAKSLSFLRETKTIWREEKPGAREIWEQYLELRKKHGDNDRAIETDIQQWFSSLPRTHLSKKWSRYKRIDSNGPWRDRDISWPGGGGPRYDVPHPDTKLPCKVPERGWIYSSPDEMQRQIKLGLVEFRDDHTEPPFRKAHIRPIPQDLLDEPDEEEEEVDETESEEEFATQVRGSYFYKQSQVAIKHFRSLMGAKVFNNPKDHMELAKLFTYTTSNDSEAIIMDFFAGSGTTGHAVMEMNQADSGNRRYILVQLPEPLDPSKKDQKGPAKYCDQLGKPRNIAELTKERLRRAAKKMQADNPDFTGDLGFRVYKLDSTNIRPWDPNPQDISGSLFAAQEHLKDGRTEQDILTELLLKLGLPLTVPIEVRTVDSYTLYAVGAGTLMACLAPRIASDEVEALAQALVAWQRELAPVGDSQVVLRDSAFRSDVAKTNFTAILEQAGFDRRNIRSL